MKIIKENEILDHNKYIFLKNKNIIEKFKNLKVSSVETSFHEKLRKTQHLNTKYMNRMPQNFFNVFSNGKKNNDEFRCNENSKLIWKQRHINILKIISSIKPFQSKLSERDIEESIEIYNKARCKLPSNQHIAKSGNKKENEINASIVEFQGKNFSNSNLNENFNEKNMMRSKFLELESKVNDKIEVNNKIEEIGNNHPPFSYPIYFSSNSSAIILPFGSIAEHIKLQKNPASANDENISKPSYLIPEPGYEHNPESFYNIVKKYTDSCLEFDISSLKTNNRRVQNEITENYFYPTHDCSDNKSKIKSIVKSINTISKENERSSICKITKPVFFFSPPKNIKIIKHLVVYRKGSFILIEDILKNYKKFILNNKVNIEIDDEILNKEKLQLIMNEILSDFTLKNSSNGFSNVIKIRKRLGGKKITGYMNLGFR